MKDYIISKGYNNDIDHLFFFAYDNIHTTLEQFFHMSINYSFVASPTQLTMFKDGISA